MIQIRVGTRRRTQVAALVAAGVLALTACSGGGTSDPSSGGTSATDDGGSVDGTTIAMTAPVTEAGESSYKLVIDAYMKAFPDRKIELHELATDGYAQAVRTQLQAGNADDLIYATPGAGNPNALLPYAEAGYAEPLTGTAAESTIPESQKTQFYLDGKLYGQALDLTVVATVENRTAMEADGVEIPKTYSELLDLCKAVAKNGKSVYVVAGGVPANAGLTTLNIAASRVYAENPDWNAQRAAGDVTFAGTDGWRQTLEAVVEMHDAGCFQPGVEGGDFAAITNGVGSGSSYSAFIPGGAAGLLKQNVPDATFTINAMPGVTADTTTIYASANNALFVNAASKNKAAAKAFLDWVAQPENAKAYAGFSGNLPIGEISAADLPADYAPIADKLASGDFLPLPNSDWANGQVYDALGQGFQGLLTGQTTVDDVLKAMDDAWNG